MRRRSPALLADALCVIGFAALGRRSHGEGMAGTAAVAAPFLIALTAAWASPWVRRDPYGLPRGAGAALVVAGLGLALRGAVFGRGLAPAFVAVAVVALGILFVAWRAVAMRVARVARPA